jgi:hypothetical protein
MKSLEWGGCGPCPFVLYMSERTLDAGIKMDSLRMQFDKVNVRYLSFVFDRF